MPSQRRYYRLQQLELRFVLQMAWCITHHIIAQYILKQLFNALISNIQSAQMQSRTVLEAVSGFTHLFSSSFEDNEVHFLSFGVPAK